MRTLFALVMALLLAVQPVGAQAPVEFTETRLVSAYHLDYYVSQGWSVGPWYYRGPGEPRQYEVHRRTMYGLADDARGLVFDMLPKEGAHPYTVTVTIEAFDELLSAVDAIQTRARQEGR